MQFSEVKTSLAAWLNRTDLTTLLDDFINIALQKLETRWNWKYMEYRATATKTISGAPAATDAYISLPTRFKAVEFLRCYPNTADVVTWMKQVDAKTAMDLYPNMTYDLGQPQIYFVQRDTSEFVVRPTPDQTYTYDILAYVFSADLSADADTNWWTLYHWRVLLYGALAEGFEYVKEMQQSQYWRQKMEEEVRQIQQMETIESTQGDWPRLSSGSMVV